jgi:hypothetical protein
MTEMDFSTLKKFYNPEDLFIFFKDIILTQTKSRVNKFLNYHTEEVLNTLMCLFDRPFIYEIWIRWINLPENEQVFYVNQSNKRIKLS